MDFDKYKNNAAYPDRNGYQKKLIEEINNTPMTASDREDALSNVKKRVGEWFMDAVKPYNEREMELNREFWTDCQQELGYGEGWSIAQCNVVESKAYSDGHSSGYSEVYNHLCELVDFLDEFLRK